MAKKRIQDLAKIDSVPQNTGGGGEKGPSFFGFSFSFRLIKRYLTKWKNKILRELRAKITVVLYRQYKFLLNFPV